MTTTYTPDQFANSAVSSIAGGAGGIGTPLSFGDLALFVASGQGAKFPTIGPFMVALGNLSGNYELVKCTTRSNDYLVISRGLEGTTAQTWQDTTTAQQVATAGSFNDLWQHIQNLNWNVRDFGAAGDGVTDDTTAIANARLTCYNAGGGTVYYPAGTYLSGSQTIYTGVYDRGAGQELSTIKLKNGANTDLFSVYVTNISLWAPPGTSSNSASYNFGFSDLTLDGNYLNQTSASYVMRFYGYGYVLQNLNVRNGWSGGILCDYNGIFPASVLFESTWNNVRSYNNRGTTSAFGIAMGGPHDSRWTSVLSYYNNSHDFYLARNNGGVQAVNCHGWNSGLADPNSATWLVETSLYAANCEAEGSPNCQLAMLGNGIVWTGGSVYSGGLAGMGIQLGQTNGNTPFTGSLNQSGGVTLFVPTSSYYVNTLIQNITHTQGSIFFSGDAGGVLDVRLVTSTATNAIYTGAVGLKTTFRYNAQGYGDPRQQVHWMNGILALGHPGGAAIDPGNGGTISTAAQSVVRLNAATTETNIVLANGTMSGQLFVVINEGSNTASFAIAGTSHVADGVGDMIAPATARAFFWDANTLLWFPLR